jgi:Protein of unknown function (DUF4013)
VRRVAESFTWPFRARLTTWLWGAVMVLLWPVLFIPLLGYALDAVRAREAPPRFRLSTRLLVDGFWLALALLITVLPFALIVRPLAAALGGSLVGGALAFFILALPWGLLVLLLLPHAAATFAATGRPADLFDVVAAVRGAIRDFATWNAVVAAIVTAWAIGLACAGLLCVGIVPGVFYAILVSAHAAASLPPQSPRRGPPAG